MPMPPKLTLLERVTLKKATWSADSMAKPAPRSVTTFPSMIVSCPRWEKAGAKGYIGQKKKGGGVMWVRQRHPV